MAHAPGGCLSRAPGRTLPRPFRFAGREIEAESLALFAAGARVLDGDADDGRFERRLRQRAAACLRAQNPASHGGGLYVCALLNHLIKEARS